MTAPHPCPDGCRPAPDPDHPDGLICEVCGDCCCDFDWPEDDGEESWHHARTCQLCGTRWGALHCPHDGAQNGCPVCGWIRPGAATPAQILGFAPRPPAG